jgi:hypothetical protein
MSGGIRWAAAALCVCAAGFGVAGCGSGDSDSTASEKQEYAMASEPPENFADRMAKLLATTEKQADCLELEQINVRSINRFECPPKKSLKRSMGSFEIVGTAEYGTGAVVDYKSGEAPDGAAIVLFAAPDRNWAISRFGMLTEPSTETDDGESRAGFRQAVEDYLEALRTRDCKAFATASFKGADSSVADICKTFAGTKKFAKRLKANPSAKLVYQGGNATYGFFTLELKKPKPQNLTFSVLKAGPNSDSFVVLDVGESPTAAQHQAAIKALKRSKKNKVQPGSMQPSTTAPEQ